MHVLFSMSCLSIICLWYNWQTLIIEYQYWCRQNPLIGGRTSTQCDIRDDKSLNVVESMYELSAHMTGMRMPWNRIFTWVVSVVSSWNWNHALHYMSNNIIVIRFKTLHIIFNFACWFILDNSMYYCSLFLRLRLQEQPQQEIRPHQYVFTHY